MAIVPIRRRFVAGTAPAGAAQLVGMPAPLRAEPQPEITTLRFYALRMNELGFIETSPNDTIAGGTDWRFRDELKQEFKT